MEIVMMTSHTTEPANQTYVTTLISLPSGEQKRKLTTHPAKILANPETSLVITNCGNGK